MLVSVPGQSHLNLVLRVERKGISIHHPSACAERKFLKVLFLGEIRRERHCVPSGSARWSADREPADLSRGRQITLEECRRQIPDRYVVETVARFIARQEGCDINFEGKKIA